MPVYEYKCRSCGDKFELLLPVSRRDDLELRCPKCDSAEIERGMSCVASSKKGGDSCSGGTCSTCGL